MTDQSRRQMLKLGGGAAVVGGTVAAIPAVAGGIDPELAATPIDPADPLLALWAKRARLRKEVKRMEQLGKVMDDDPRVTEYFAIADQIAESRTTTYTGFLVQALVLDWMIDLGGDLPENRCATNMATIARRMLVRGGVDASLLEVSAA